MALLSFLQVQLVYLLATVMALGLAGILWLNREKTGAVTLAFGSLTLALWSSSLFGMAVTGDTLSRIFLRTMYLGVVLVTLVVFVFALEYTGRERYLTPKVLAVLAIHPTVTMFFVIFNPDTLFFLNISDSLGPMIDNSELLHGPAFYVHTLYSYVLLASVAAMFLDLLFRSTRPLYRGQAVALLLANVTPWMLNAVFLFGPVEFDATPIGFIVSTSLFTVAIVRYRLIDITPIAREKVTENVRDGMFVVDTDDNILDSNPSFRALVGADEGSLVGIQTTTLFAELPELQAEYESITAEATTTERQISYSDRHLNVQATPIFDDRERHVGWLFLVHDVTELVQRERDLEEQIEKLDQFASIVSHDLRNPLNVAHGYVQQTRVTGDLDHLEKTEEAMERMEAIIEDTLTLAREGQDVTEPETVALEAVAGDAWQNVDTDGASFESDRETIVADRERLQRLLENLIRNSIEHGILDADKPSEGHRIEISIESQRPDSVTVSVADNGVGIPDDEIRKVFQSGYTTNENGTGMGLAIVEQIANAHGWEVTAAHSGDDGARFDISGVAREV